MSSQPHLQIFTPSRTTHDEELIFPLFSRLPKELRLKIWRHSLQRQRIIKLRLKSQAEQNATQAADSTVSSRKSERYCAVVDGYQVLSKLLRVNSESREAALEFYRVRIPCRLWAGAKADMVTRLTSTHLYQPEPLGTRSGILHFNPEYDFLRISPEMPVKDTLVDFLYHLKTTHDPQGVGLLNLAVDLNDLNANDLYLLQSPDLDPRVKKAFVETLSQLHEVFFVSTPRAGRHILGWLSGIPTSETILNRSFPISTMTPTFERQHRDPRPISQDLRQVFVGTSDQRHVIQLWRRLLKKWGVSAPQIQYRFYLAFEPMEQDQVYNRGRAERWLKKEDDAWNGVERQQQQDQEDSPVSFSRLSKEKNIRWPIGAESEKYKNEDLEKAVKPAFGFWLFPIDALGPLREEGVSEEEGFRHKPKQLLDMTAYWPELALSSLP